MSQTERKGTNLTLALTRGRIFKSASALLRSADLLPEEDLALSRKLIFNHDGRRIFFLRGTDAATYVRHGIADVGVIGRDVILEHGCRGLCEVADLSLSRCRLMSAALVGRAMPEGRLRVATKFVNVARQHYEQKGLQVDIIPLYGGMELAPIVGLADVIVDIVDTGRTLRANGLEPLELIAEVSARLIVNHAALKTKRRQIDALIGRISEAMERSAGARAAC